MPLELLGVPKQLFVVEELEEALVELSDVVPPVFRELYHHHDQVELPDGDEVRHDEGADGGGGSTPPSSGRSGSCRIRRTVGPTNPVPLNSHFTFNRDRTSCMGILLSVIIQLRTKKHLIFSVLPGLKSDLQVLGLCLNVKKSKEDLPSESEALFYSG